MEPKWGPESLRGPLGSHLEHRSKKGLDFEAPEGHFGTLFGPRNPPKSMPKTMFFSKAFPWSIFVVFPLFFGVFYMIFGYLLEFVLAMFEKGPTCVSYWFLQYKLKFRPLEIDLKIDKNPLRNRIPAPKGPRIEKSDVFGAFLVPKGSKMRAKIDKKTMLKKMKKKVKKIQNMQKKPWRIRSSAEYADPASLRVLEDGVLPLIAARSNHAGEVSTETPRIVYASRVPPRPPREWLFGGFEGSRTTSIAGTS